MNPKNKLAEMPVRPLLYTMAVPLMLSLLIQSLYNIVDSLFVARISEDAMTALSLVFPIQNFSNAIAIGFGIGINAMIALYLGAGDREKAETAATHGFVLSLVHGVVMMAVSIAIMPGFLRRFTQDEELIAASLQDRLHQPYRRRLIPEYDKIEALANQNGCRAVCISGAGPTILCVTRDEGFAARMERAVFPLEHHWQVRDLPVDYHGAVKLS